MVDLKILEELSNAFGPSGFDLAASILPVSLPTR